MPNISIETLLEKWSPVLDHEDMKPIENMDRRKVTAQLLENTEKQAIDDAMASSAASGMILGKTQTLQETSPTNQTGAAIANYDPVLISLIRRTAPKMIAYDVCGVQPMTGPTGLIFALRSRYASQTGDEAFYNEANTGFSTSVAGVANTLVGGANLGNVGTTPTGNTSTYNFAGGMTTSQAEALGSSGNVDFAEMAFDIDRIQVTAKSRALKAEYSTEMAQDLRVIHGLSAEDELSNILVGEILAEINREVIRTIYVTATPGADQGDVTAAGTFDLDTDSNGRWMGEKYAGMYMQMDRDANSVARKTRRGKANLMICSSDVASALRMAKVMDITEASKLKVDDAGNTFAGTLDSGVRVYIDPYASSQYYIMGYKGSSGFDAGFFYCPYVPLQKARAVGENNFQPKIAFKTRYGMVANPFSQGATASDGTLTMNVNVYYRRVTIANLL